MLSSMRKPVAKVVTFVLFGLLILSFAVWGIGDIFRGPGHSTAVAEVGEIAIDQQEFSRDLSRELRRLRSSLGQRLDVEDARALGLVDQVLRNLINRALFDQKAQDLGMVISEDRIRQAIVSEPAFQNSFGDFDRTRFIQTLRNASLSEGQFVAGLRRDLQRGQIARSITGAISAPAAMAETLYTFTEETRTAEAIEIEIASIIDLPSPNEAALVDFHAANGADFMSPQTRSVSFIHIRPQDLLAEISISPDEVRADFEARRDDFAVAERRSLEQMVLFDEAAAKEAKSKLDGGADFATVATEASGGDPIDLGTVTKDELARQLTELADQVFGVAEGAVSDPIQSSFGWHIVHVRAIEPGEEPDFEKARGQIEEDLGMQAAIDSIISIANQLDDELGGGASLEDAAAALNLTVVEVPAIDARGRDGAGNAIVDLPPLAELLEAIDDTEVGESSLLLETDEGGFFVVRIDGTTPSALRPFTDVRAAVIRRWELAQREELASARAEALLERANEGVALEKIAEDEGLDLQVRGPVDRGGQGDGISVSRELAGKLFELEPGGVTMAQDGAGYIVAKLVDVNRPAPASDPEGLSGLRDDLARNLENDLMTEFAEALSQDYGITINTRLVDDLVAGF